MSRLSTEHQDLLRRFVLRARIVQDHSLAKDVRVLVQLAATTSKVVVTVNRSTGERSVELGAVKLIPTEQLESAAARVRPVFLKGDRVHYVEGTGYLRRNHGGHHRSVRRLWGRRSLEFFSASSDGTPIGSFSNGEHQALTTKNRTPGFLSEGPVLSAWCGAQSEDHIPSTVEA